MHFEFIILGLLEACVSLRLKNLVIVRRMCKAEAG